MLDLDKDEGLTAEDYLNTLVTKAPTVASLIHPIQRLIICKGFVAFATSINSDTAEED